MEDLLTPEEVAAVMKVKTITVKDWLRDGRLKGVKTGRLWRIRKQNVEDFIENQEKAKLSPEEDFVSELLRGINEDLSRIIGKEKTLEMQEAINNRLQDRGLQKINWRKIDNV